MKFLKNKKNMKIVAFTDKDGGYTAYMRDFPSVIIQVDEVSEIKPKLLDVFHDIIHGSEIDEHKLNL